MNPMKRCAVAALVLAAAALLVMPAQAKAKGAISDWGPVQMTNTGGEPLASGQAGLSRITYLFSYSFDDWNYTVCYRARLTIECKNLTPRATYSTPAGTFTANRKGQGKVSGDVTIEVRYNNWTGLTWPYQITVIRVDAGGTDTTILVTCYPK